MFNSKTNHAHEEEDEADGDDEDDFYNYDDYDSHPYANRGCDNDNSDNNGGAGTLHQPKNSHQDGFVVSKKVEVNSSDFW